MTYQPHSFSLSLPQVKKLSSGLTVRLTNSKLTGDKVVYLTKSQLTKVQKAMQTKKGMDLKLSSVQLKFNVKNGFGFFDKLKNAGKYVYDQLKEPVGDYLKKEGFNYVKDKILPRLANKGMELVDKTLKRAGAGRPRGKGIRQGIVPFVQQGEGFFSDIGDFVSDSAKGLRDAALIGVSQGIKGRIAGRGRGRPRKSGNGLNGIVAIQQPKERMHRFGEGFFSDIGDFVSDSAKGLRDAALIGVSQGIRGRIAGRGRGRPKKTQGTGFWNNLNIPQDKPINKSLLTRGMPPPFIDTSVYSKSGKSIILAGNQR